MRAASGCWLMSRERIWAPEHDRSRSLGWLALKWIEHFCIHGPGDVEGTPLASLPLDPEFAGLVLDYYALDRSGRRLYDSAFTSRPKGRAKSELAGIVVLFEGFGPCRFAGWAEGGEVYEWRDFRYTYEPGEPLGRQIVYPFIRCLATEEEQAGNTYDNVYFNLTHGPLSEGLPSNAAGLTRTILPHGGEIVPSTAANASKDGGKETHVVFDETHLYVLPELKRMYRTVRRNMAKRRDAEPWSHETSTMYLPGEDSIAEGTHETARKILAGKLRRGRLLFDHRQADDDVDLEDEAALTVALREAYGDFADMMDLRRIIDEIYDPRNLVGDSRRYFLNQPTSAIDAFLAAHEWAGCLDETKQIEPGDVITLGFDGSRGDRARGRKPDATGIIATRLGDGHQQVFGHWEAPDSHFDGWTPPVPEVDDAIDRAFTGFLVAGAYFDPAGGWGSKVNDWENKYGSRLLKTRTGRQLKVKNDHPFEWWMTGGRSEYVQRALESFASAVRNEELTHGHHQAFTAHVLNARRRLRATKLIIAKENDYSPKKIDLCVAGVLSYQARLDAIAAGIGAKPKRSVPVRVR
jgi:hypothetical protein